MRIREIDSPNASAVELLAIHAIERACLAELVPGDPGQSAEEAVAFLRNVPTTQQRFRWLADAGGETVGTAGLYVHSPSAVFLHLFVAPAHRRKGAGTALLDAVRGRARELDLASVYSHHANAAGAAFAARAGGADDQRDVRLILDLRRAVLPEPTLPAGWSLVTWIGRAPNDLVDSYVRARAAMRDAPLAEGVELPEESVATMRAMEDSLAARKRELRVTVALDNTREIGAFTDLRITPRSKVALTDDTGTVGSARGRGIATAVKLESLRRLRGDHPGSELVTTMNAEENRAMRRINERIGFVAVATMTTTVITL